MKICKHCNITKNLTEFGNNKRYKDTTENICKECKKIKYALDRDRNLISQKKWREKNKNYQKEWAKKQGEQLIEYRKEYYKKNKEIFITRKQEWRKLNPVKAYQEGKNYRDKYRDKVNEYSRLWKETKRFTDPCYKIKENISRRLRYEFKKEKSTNDYLPYSIEQLKISLETKFIDGMNWNNYGSHWHIDHKIPCKAWNQKDTLDLYMCWHKLNLQPMWKLENIRKKNIYNDEDKIELIRRIKMLEFGI
jgi:hypothetical protein